MVDPDPSPKLAMAGRLHWNMEKTTQNCGRKWKGVMSQSVVIPVENRDQMDQGHSFVLASAGNLHNLKTTSSTE